MLIFVKPATRWSISEATARIRTMTIPTLSSRAVAAGNVERGVAVCGSGVSASVCVNKITGVRAGLIHDHFSAQQGVEDDDMNIICMGGRVVGPAVARNLVDTFLAAEFSGAERHRRRLRKVASLETQVVSD